MKKLLVILALLSVFACSGKKEDEKQNAENSSVQTETVNVKKEEAEKKDGSYEASLVERIEALEKEVQPALDSGVSADMLNAAATLSEAWEKELNTIYGLLMKELPESEKEKLRTAQREWVKKREEAGKQKNSEESGGGNIGTLLSAGTEEEMTKERVLELARMYDSIHK